MKTVHDIYFIASINLLRTCTQIVVIIKSANQFYSDIYKYSKYGHLSSTSKGRFSVTKYSKFLKKHSLSICIQYHINIIFDEQSRFQLHS